MKFTAIIGVISITIIVLIVAAFTFAHVESIREQQLKKANQSIQGWVTDISKSESIVYQSNTVDVYVVTLSNESVENNTMSYNMIFMDTYPPFFNVHLRFYYEKITQGPDSFFIIHDIETLE